MCKFATRPRAEAVAPVHVQQEATPVGPSIDTDAIRKQLASLARDKGDAHKVFESILSGTQGNSLEYERAKVRTAQAGEVRQFADGRHSSDYNPSVDGRARFDFSETQDVVSHTERTVHTTRGLLGRQRQHVVEQQVQTLVSEKVRFDFNLSEQLDIKVGQNDTAFVNAAIQTGHKEINLTQRDGQGSLALVLGKDQTLKEISFDPERGRALVVTDSATFTVVGVTRPEGLLIGREGSGNTPAGFISVASVASEVTNGRREIFEADKKALQQVASIAAEKATNIVNGVSSALKSYLTAPRPSPPPGIAVNSAPSNPPRPPETPATKPVPATPDKAEIADLMAKRAALEQRLADLTKRVETLNQQTVTIVERIKRAEASLSAAESKFTEPAKTVEPPPPLPIPEKTHSSPKATIESDSRINKAGPRESSELANAPKNNAKVSSLQPIHTAFIENSFTCADGTVIKGFSGAISTVSNSIFGKLRRETRNIFLADLNQFSGDLSSEDSIRRTFEAARNNFKGTAVSSKDIATIAAHSGPLANKNIVVVEDSNRFELVSSGQYVARIVDKENLNTLLKNNVVGETIKLEDVLTTYPDPVIVFGVELSRESESL